LDNPVSRRTFLKKSVGAAALAGLGVCARSLPSWALSAYEEARGAEAAVDLGVATGSPAWAVGRALDLIGGIGRFVKRGDFVLLKPNMSFGTPPEMGATTSPEVVKAVAIECLEAGARRVLVADHTIRAAKVSLEYTGIEPALKGLDGVQTAALNDESRYRKVSIPRGQALREAAVAEELDRADVLVNLPVAKSHSATGVSLGIKNLMGLVWDRRVFHTGVLDQSIADLATLIRPQLTIMDAMQAMVQGGPSGPGRTVRLNRIVAGVDDVAVDSYTVGLTKWYNRKFTGKQVAHLAAASRMELGQIDVDQLRIAFDQEAPREENSQGE